MANSFKYTSYQTGEEVVINNFDINKLLKLRYYQMKDWFGNPDSITCIMSVTYQNIQELLRSIEYREAVINFISENLDIKHGSKEWYYAINYIFTVIKPPSGYIMPGHDKRSGTRKLYEEYIYEPRDMYDEARTILNFKIDHERVVKLGSTASFSKDTNQTHQKIKKIDQYKKERESNYEGVDRDGLILRINEMIDSRDYWKKQHEMIEERKSHLREQLTEALKDLEDHKSQVRVLGLRNKSLQRDVSYLSSEIQKLRRQVSSSFNDMFSSNDNLNSLLRESPPKAVKIIRKKFMLAAHPDKLRDVMRGLSSEEQQAINRLFNYLQNKLKGN